MHYKIATLKVQLDKLEIIVSKTLFGKVIVEFNGQTISIQYTAERAIDIINHNFDKIKSYYLSNLSKNQASNINFDDLSTISVKILVNYLEQYCRWNKQHTKSNYDLKFYEKDFYHPATYDIIIFFLKHKYPDNWKSISGGYIYI